MDVKKMTAGQIAEMSMEQFNSLTAKEARDALAKVRKSVNQRMRRLDNSGVFSPAAEGMKKNGLKPQKGLNRNQTLAELKKGINFLGAKTSTTTGARNVQNRIRDDLGLPKTASNEEVKDIYAQFHKLQEEYPSILTEAAGGIRYAENKRKIGTMFRSGASIDDIHAEIKRIYTEQAGKDAETAASVESGF